MDTPIYDFIEEYKASGISRFHMPGHKGKKFLGCENSDITEIEGADVLCMADGIIARSQQKQQRLMPRAFFVQEKHFILQKVHHFVLKQCLWLYLWSHADIAFLSMNIYYHQEIYTVQWLMHVHLLVLKLNL